MKDMMIDVFINFQCYKTMDYNIQNINPGADIQVLVEQRGTPRQPCEQLLFASYVSNNVITNIFRFKTTFMMSLY